MNKIYILIGAILVGFVLFLELKWLIEINEAHNYLKRKTEWCYEQNGIMIDNNCFSKDMKLIE